MKNLIAQFLSNPLSSTFGFTKGDKTFFLEKQDKAYPLCKTPFVDVMHDFGGFSKVIASFKDYINNPEATAAAIEREILYYQIQCYAQEHPEEFPIDGGEWEED